MVPDYPKFSGLVQKMYYIRRIYLVFGTNLASKSKTFMPELHLQILLFGTNYLATYAPNHQKTPYLMPNLQFFVPMPMVATPCMYLLLYTYSISCIVSEYCVNDGKL